MAIVGKLYMANKNYVDLLTRSGRKVVQPTVALAIDRYTNVSGPYGVKVRYLLGEDKNLLEEDTFHIYFDLLDIDI